MWVAFKNKFAYFSGRLKPSQQQIFFRTYQWVLDVIGIDFFFFLGGTNVWNLLFSVLASCINFIGIYFVGLLDVFYVEAEETAGSGKAGTAGHVFIAVGIGFSHRDVSLVMSSFKLPIYSRFRFSSSYSSRWETYTIRNTTNWTEGRITCFWSQRNKKEHLR